MKNSVKVGILRQNILENTILTRVLSFLSENPNKTYTGIEIAEKFKKTRMAVFLSLKTLSKGGLVKRESRGKAYFYKINQENPIVKQFKVLKNVIELEPFTEKLRHIAIKIVLFGSTSRGEDTAESDFDLLVVTNDIDAARKQVQKFRIKRKIELKAFTPLGLAKLREKEKVFYSEIDRGITLWEGE